MTIMTSRAHKPHCASRGRITKLRKARFSYRQPERNIKPSKSCDADLAAPTVSGSPFYTLHTGQLTISYVPDVFGGIRRQVEAASAQVELQQFMFEATYLTLTSNIALAAIQEASLKEQIQV